MNTFQNYPTHILNKEAESKTFWMVVRLGALSCTKADAHPMKEHSSFAAAAEEAERLAAKHPTHPRGFAVLQAQRVVKADITLKITSLT
jgi:hypothetical protein